MNSIFQKTKLFEPRLLDDGTVQFIPLGSQTDVEHDRQVIENDFEDDHLLSETDMQKRFGQYGWQK